MTASVWCGTVPDGAKYGIRASGPAELRFDRRRVLVDPHATEVWFADAHRRDDARPGAVSRRRGNTAGGRIGVAGGHGAPRHTSRPLVVYEAHVRGLTKRRERDDGGTFSAAIDELPRLAAMGVSVLELLPVHQFDPDERNYWGYMALVFGAVHRQYAATGRPPRSSPISSPPRTITTSRSGSTSCSTTRPKRTSSARPTTCAALADRDYYVVNDDGSYVDDAGTGNILDASSAPAQELVIEALDRFAGLGVDGFRFDLASVLARDP